MRIIVTDASALLEYLFGTDVALSVKETVRRGDVDLHVPALCDVEIVAGLRRALLRKVVSTRRAAEALEDYLDLPLRKHGHEALLARILELHANFSAYDATYVALAEKIGAELLTADERLGRAVRTHTSVAVVLSR